MTYEVVGKFYMCPRCMEPSLEASPCPKCGGERVTCRPGDPDDPCRRPFTTETGQTRSRAPVWWLEALGTLDPETIAKLRKKLMASE